MNQLRGFCTAIVTKPKRKAIKPGFDRPIINKMRARKTDLEAAATASNLDFRIVGATILHRYPTISAEAQPWEADFFELQEKIEAKKREILINEVRGTDHAIIPEHNPTYDEIVEGMPFTPASRTTEADEKNDRKSLNRKLSESLFFIVKRNRDDYSWQFPQGRILETETNMRQTVERVIDRAAGRTNRWFISNAPIGYYMYEYPSAMKQNRNQFGAKVFFYRAQLISFSVKLETRLYKDYAWVTRDELSEYLDPETYELVSNLLPYY